jgi:diguanylate cyclase (GGDEF)-like protein
MEDNFAFLLPVMMGTFSVVFFLLARMRLQLPSALAWGIAFGSGAAAFSVGLLPVPVEWQALIGDLLFFVSFYAYGEGLLVRFDRPRLAGLRIGFAAACMVVDAYVIFALHSLDTELLLVDVALTVLLAVPVAMVLTRPRHVVDRALVAIAGLVVLDTLVRVILFNFVFTTSDALTDFTSSQYAFFMQISGGALGLCFALAALGSVLVDIVARYRDAAERDPLTGLFNRRGFEEALARAQKSSDGVVLSCDIDHFKQVNDSYGHASGDLVIAECARQLLKGLPDGAIAARFGGEEFIGFMPGASMAEGRKIAQTICDRFAQTSWPQLRQGQKITISVGVTPLMSIDRSIHDAIARADHALYSAKEAGRNQVATEGLLPLAV